MLKTVELPAGVAHLDSGLADMDRDTFPHGGSGKSSGGDSERLDIYEASVVRFSTKVGKWNKVSLDWHRLNSCVKEMKLMVQ